MLDVYFSIPMLLQFQITISNSILIRIWSHLFIFNKLIMLDVHFSIPMLLQFQITLSISISILIRIWSHLFILIILKNNLDNILIGRSLGPSRLPRN